MNSAVFVTFLGEMIQPGTIRVLHCRVTEWTIHIVLWCRNTILTLLPLIEFVFADSEACEGDKCFKLKELFAKGHSVFLPVTSHGT